MEIYQIDNDCTVINRDDCITYNGSIRYTTETVMRINTTTTTTNTNTKITTINRYPDLYASLFSIYSAVQLVAIYGIGVYHQIYLQSSSSS
jgi:hypothetical protein